MSLDVFPSNLRGLTYPVEKTSEFNTLVQSAPNLLETTVAQTRNPVWEWQFIYDVLWDDDAHKIAGYADYRRLQGFILKQGGRASEFLYTDPTDNAVGPALISGVPNTMAQLQLLDDGAGHYYSPIQRSFGGQFLEDITDLNGAFAVYANAVLKTVSAGDYSIIGPGLALPGQSFMGLVVAWTAPGPWMINVGYPLGTTILDPAGHIQLCTTAGSTLGASGAPNFNDAGGTTADHGTLVWTDQGYNPAPTGPINAQFSYYFRVKFGEDKHDFTQFMNQFWTLGGSESSSGGTLTLRSSRPVQL